jgi:hypothetical protein
VPVEKFINKNRIGISERKQCDPEYFLKQQLIKKRNIGKKRKRPYKMINAPNRKRKNSDRKIKELFIFFAFKIYQQKNNGSKKTYNGRYFVSINIIECS